MTLHLKKKKEKHLKYSAVLTHYQIIFNHVEK